MRRNLMFAYGSNMLQEQAINRMPNLIKIGKAELLNHSFYFTGNGVASVKSSNFDSVPGVLYSVTDEDFNKMDIYEGFPFVYDCHLLTIKINNKLKKAWVYINNSKKLNIIPKQEYLNKIIVGAKNLEIKELYILDAYKKAVESIK